LPLRLNLSAGSKPELGEEWVNHDRFKHADYIAVEHDLVESPWPWEDNTFDEIKAWDIMEHLPRALPFIEELWRISKHGAKVLVHTSWASGHDGERGVWRDPTHVRPFHEESFHYFDPDQGGFWFAEYGRFYSKARFHIDNISLESPDCIGFYLTALKDGLNA
jgi:hypothetical protein